MQTTAIATLQLLSSSPSTTCTPIIKADWFLLVVAVVVAVAVVVTVKERTNLLLISFHPPAEVACVVFKKKKVQVNSQNEERARTFTYP